MLLDECAAGAVETALGQAATVEHRDGAFRVSFGRSCGPAPALVIATGGPSIPKIGATGFAYDLARRFGLKIVEPRPALVPLTLSGEEALFTTLSGVSTEVVARAGQGAASARRPCSPIAACPGPAILQVSSYWRHGEPVTIDFLPDRPPAGFGRPSATSRAPRFARLLGRIAARPACRDACRAARRWAAISPTFPTAARGCRAAPRRLALHAERQRRLRQGRGHDRRHQHRRPVLADDGSRSGPRPLRDRRGGRRHRLARRL